MTQRGKRFSQHTAREQGKYNLQLLSPLSLPPASGLQPPHEHPSGSAPPSPGIIHYYPNYYLLCMHGDQNKQAGQPPPQQQKSPPPPRGPQVECSNDSSRAAAEETGKFQPNLAVLIITVIMTTSGRRGAGGIPTNPSLDPR